MESICADLKTLDTAKRNLTFTITSLKRYMMLTTAMEQLRAMMDALKYKEAGNLIRATKELLDYFKDY